MKKVLSWPGEFVFGLRKTDDVMMSRLTPIIVDVATGLREGRDFNGAVEEASRRHACLDDYFEYSPLNAGETFSLKQKWVYLESEIRQFRFINIETKKTIPFDVEDAGAAAFLDAVGVCGAGMYSHPEARNLLSPASMEIVNMFMRAGLVEEAGAENNDSGRGLDRPGIYRLQHAGLLFKTKSSGVITDPHLRSEFEFQPAGTTFRPREVLARVTAVVISHGHYDHYDLASLSMFPKDTPIVVPKVPRETILADDMERRLKRLGFRNVIAAKWYDPPLKFGDIEVQVLPFYGEQATLSEWPFFEDVWNYGNTYLIKTPDLTSWTLIDSGRDVRGSMVDVAHWIFKNHGPVDAVFSNLRRFCVKSPLYINSGRNWLTLSPDQRKRLDQMKNDCITLGPEGVAEICEIVKAKRFVPYAHWWGPLGSVPEYDLKGGQVLHDLFESRKMTTTLMNWTIGERFIP